MSNDHKFNGWTNYETWNCKLWMDNDQGESEYWAERAKEVDDVADLARELEDYYDERAGEWMKDQCSFFAVIFNAALKEVNWHEIAEHLYEENHEEVEEEA